jgi:hypothetical protein
VKTLIRSLPALLVALLALSTNAAAATEPGQAPADPHGSTVRDWLQLQASGRQAAPSPRQPGDAATRTYRRYLESFEQPIPESYFKGQEGFRNK